MTKLLKILTQLILLLLGIFTLISCTDTDDGFSVRRECVDVGSVSVGDSVKASFTFKNNSQRDLVLTFLPECDCTTVSASTLELAPRKCGVLDVRVAVEQYGDFIKYVYVQAAGSDAFVTVSVKGSGK